MTDSGQKQGLPDLIHKLSAERRFQFDVERAGFALALQRLSEPGSDLQGSHWLKTVECEGFESLELQHLYRTVGFLHDVRADLEKELFLRDRDLFSQKLDLLFLDTTSTYVYGQRETDFRKRGYSRDHRGDLLQYVICVAVDAKGWPVTWEIFPGNTADIEAFKQIVARMKERLPIGKVIVVADRAMLSAETLNLVFKLFPAVPQEEAMRRRQQMRRPRQMTLSHESATGMGLKAPEPEVGEGTGAAAARTSRPQPAEKIAPVQVGEKTGRNDPCPCGSGKKFKHCHGA